MTGYHVTPRRNRLAISRWGLIPRDTESHPRAHFHNDAPENAGVEAVYVHETLKAAENWRDNFYESYNVFDTSELDIWAVDIDGLPHEHDAYRYAYYLRRSLRVLARVSPDRLTLAAA